MSEENSHDHGSQEQSATMREFRMHKELLWSVIQAQAGTADKAILEGVMNAVDAVATTCRIEIDQDGFVIEDDGVGFESKQVIEEFFETFGAPHKEGDAIYGRFRMGRGQLFAFASTVWRTGRFEMRVDIMRDGLEYKLEEGLEQRNGCRIEGKWYEPMKSSAVYRSVMDIRRLCAWMQIPVIVNSVQANRLPQNEKWDIETEDAFTKLSPSGALSVYNMGAFVKHYSADEFGVSGVVVSKTALKVNFARNDVLTSRCLVWKRIMGTLVELRGQLKTKAVLTESERNALARALAAGEIQYAEIANIGLMFDAKGHYRSLASLREKRVCMALDKTELGIGERIIDSGLGVCLSIKAISSFGVEDLASFLKLIRDSPSGARDYWFEASTVRGLAPDITSFHDVIESSRLPPHQAALLVGLQALGDAVAFSMSVFLAKLESHSPDCFEPFRQAETHPKVPKRKIVLGKSDTADAWTDGEHYIAFNVELVRQAVSNGGQPRVQSFLMLMCHEYCHNGTDIGGHSHSPEFYKFFHDFVSLCASDFSIRRATYTLLKAYEEAITKLGKMPKPGIASSIRCNTDELGTMDRVMGESAFVLDQSLRSCK